MSAEQTYIAIIGDLRHSRRVSDRSGLQRTLIEAVRKLNQELWQGQPQRNLAAPIALTAGDEVQALFTRHSLAFQVMESLSSAARPSNFTFGVGYGALSTDLYENVALIDGPAFHEARSALSVARFDSSWAAAGGFGSDTSLITGLLYLLGAVRERWTVRQMEIIGTVGQAETQNAAAEALGVSPSVVSESLKAAFFTQYRLGRQALLSLLDGPR